MAPEMYELPLVDSKVDIWALGRIFAYTLTGGKHPFGDDPDIRAIRIKSKESMLLKIEDLKRPYCDDLSSFEMIQSMLEIESSNGHQLSRSSSSSMFKLSRQQ